MNLQSHFEAEFEFAKLDEESRSVLRAAFDIWHDQGHSGGSAGILIGSLKAWRKSLTPIDDNASLLSGFSRLLFENPNLDDTKRDQLLGQFITLVSYRPLTPLTGEEDEWAEHSYGSKQNKRCSAVFMDDDGIARFLDGRIFYTPSSYSSDFIGYHNFYSSVEVTFPWVQPDDIEKHFYADRDGALEISPEHAAAISDTRAVTQAAGFINGDYINLESFFIHKDQQEALSALFTRFIKLMGTFDQKTRKRALMSLDNVYWTDDYESGNEIVPIGGMFRGETLPRTLVAPLARLIAMIPLDAKLVGDELVWFRGARFVINFTKPMFPSQKFQSWVEVTSKRFNDKVVVSLVKASDKPDEITYFDRVGYEVKYVGDDENYLYQMRRRFKIKHPKEKVAVIDQTLTSDNANPVQA